MNYRQLEIFVAVLGQGSVTAAAEQLGLTQPAVSKSLKALEAELGVRLFLRGARGLRATDEGRALYLEAARLTESYGHVEGFARNLGQMEHARLEISCIPALSTDWMPQHVAHFLADYPEAALCFRSRSSPETVQLVARGELDLGLSQARAEDSTVEKTRLFDLHAVCVIPRGHPLAAKPSIALADLHGARIIALSGPDALRRELEARMLMAGYAVQSRVEVAHGAMLCRMAGYAGLIGVVDTESARLHDPRMVVVRPLEQPLLTPIYLLQNSFKAQSLMSRKFVEHLVAATAPLRAGLSRPPAEYEGWQAAERPRLA